jgi:hypothetical protein
LFVQALERHGDRSGVYVVEFAFEFGAGPGLLVVAAEYLEDEHTLGGFLLAWVSTLVGHRKNSLSSCAGPGAVAPVSGPTGLQNHPTLYRAPLVAKGVA